MEERGNVVVVATVVAIVAASGGGGGWREAVSECLIMRWKEIHCKCGGNNNPEPGNLFFWGRQQFQDVLVIRNLFPPDTKTGENYPAPPYIEPRLLKLRKDDKK